MRTLVTAMLALLLTAPCLATIINVPSDHPTIQAGIDAAANGDVVQVAAGTYTGNGNMNIDFNGKAVSLISEAGPEATEIVCGLDSVSLEHRRAFLFNSGEGSSTVIHGFTIRGADNYFDDGGSILCINSSPIIENCIFRDNVAIRWGGAIYLDDYAAPQILDCLFENNQISYRAGYGGAIGGWTCSPYIENCVFRNNSSGGYGGAIFFTHGNYPVLKNCVFESNATTHGGGYGLYDVDGELENCIFMRNSASQLGGAVFLQDNCSPLFKNCTFYDNNGATGGAFFIDERYGWQTSPLFLNTILAYNKGDSVFVIRDATPRFECTDIYGNIADWDGYQAAFLGVDGNISEDPLFCDTAAGDLGISYYSPCRPELNSCGVLMGASDYSCGFNPYIINIEKTHNTLQGHYVEVSITVDHTELEMGGFDFLIAYDASALTFMEATPGQLLEDCGWEYFTYRYGVEGNCGDACPSGLLRIIAMAETNNGPNHPSCYGPPDTDPHELVEMKFFVTNDRTFECQYAPIRFFWVDCNDNAISSLTGDTLFVSDHVYEFDGTDITDSTFGFPTYFGIQAGCLEGGGPDKPAPIPYINFVGGGVDIVCADSIDVRGDINANGVENEIADAVMFTNYFITGLNAFGTHVEASIAASDVNADGIALSVADVVYLVRVITGDAPPYPKPMPYANTSEVILSVNRSLAQVSSESPVDLGAAYFVFEYAGFEIGEPYLNDGASEMSILYRDEGGLLKILVYSLERGMRIPAGVENILAIPIFGDGSMRLTESQLSDYFGNLLTVKNRDEAILPSDFALHQNHPNPFNPATEIAFTLGTPAHIRLNIYNIMGQRVTTLVDGWQTAGYHSVIWDGTDESGLIVANGIYFYRITAGEFAAVKKMLLVK